MEIIMIDVIVVFIILTYAIVAIKVDEWSNLSALGLGTEVPGFYLRYSGAFSIIQMGLFVCSLISIFGISIAPWYIGVIILLLVWFSAGAIGRKRAFNRYRKIWKESISLPGSEVEIATRAENSRKSDQELGETVALMYKFDSMRK